MGNLSPHFSSWEFADHVTGEVKVDHVLLQRLELLRHLAGDRSLSIVSGYRSPATNRAVGGALHSQHLYGKAADIPQGYASIDLAREAGFTGIGYRGHWAVHLDVRAGSRVVFAD